MSISNVLLSLDFLRSVQLASSSDLIFISSTRFFSVLSCQTVDRKLAVVQTMGKRYSSSIWKSSVRIMLVVRFGMYFLRPLWSRAYHQIFISDFQFGGVFFGYLFMIEIAAKHNFLLKKHFLPCKNGHFVYKGKYPKIQRKIGHKFVLAIVY